MLRRPLLLLANAAQRFLIPRTTVKHCMASVEMSAAAGEAASQASVETSADVPETIAAAPETAAKRTADEEDGPSAKKLKPEDEQEEKKVQNKFCNEVNRENHSSDHYWDHSPCGLSINRHHSNVACKMLAILSLLHWFKQTWQYYF